MTITRDSSEKVDVLIVGAGPAGLVSALSLARAGVKVKIVDKNPAKVAAGHADGVMPRTTEVLQSYGVAESLLRDAHHVYSIVNYNHNNEKGGIEYAGRVPMINEPTARYNFCVLQHQGNIEGVLIDALTKEGVTIDRPAYPTALQISTDAKELADPQAYPVKVHLNVADEKHPTKVVYAKFVLGSDGAHSWVRKAAGIVMEGEQTAHVWGAIDFVPSPESNFPDWRNITTVNAKDVGIMLIAREEDKVRLYIELGSEEGLLDAKTGRVDLKQFSAEKLLEVANKAFAPFTLTTTPDKVDWWTVYIIGQRVASQFSVHERVLIAGDACHTHSPKGGQGMNISMNDAHNLAWKLAHVVKGWADISLLKTYEFERRSLAQEVIAFDKWFSAGFSAKSRSELFKDSTEAPPGPLEAFRAFSGLTSGVGIQYRPSIIVAPSHQDCASALTIGKRILPQIALYAANRRPVNMQDTCPADSRFKILVFTEDLLEADQVQRLKVAASELDVLTSKRYPNAAFDVVTIIKGMPDSMNYMDMPVNLRVHWRNVLVDETHFAEAKAGKVYEAYGVGAAGALVVVRPDGYVAAMAPLTDVESIGQYFSGFFRQQ